MKRRDPSAIEPPAAPRDSLGGSFLARVRTAVPFAVLLGLTAAAIWPAIAPRVTEELAIARLPAADRAVAIALRERVFGKLDTLAVSAADRTALADFYRERHYALLWITQGQANARARAAIAVLRNVAVDGLYPEDYPVPAIATAHDPTALAAAELKLTATALTYALHARYGRLSFERISEDIEYERSGPTRADILATIAAAADPAAALDSFNPQQPGYRALKAALADLHAHGLDPTRVIDARRGLPINRIGDIVLANMERWRWMPRDLGATHVIVNIPDFTLRLVHEGATAFETKIVVGRREWPTPLISAKMTSITVNPSWRVPRSIIEKEYLPAMVNDPDLPRRLGLLVTTNDNGIVRMYQPAGDFNAFGRLSFNFPNRFHVFQHDTPERNLFQQDYRAFSHGCMRVQYPLTYAEKLLAIVRPRDGYTGWRLQTMFSREAINIDFKEHPVPVHMTYQTAFADQDGRLIIRDDLYGYDRRIITALVAGAPRRTVVVASAGSLQ